MEQRKPAELNRIARDTEAWKQIENKLADRYGRRIIYDREFLKAKRDIYKHIRKKYQNKSLNLFERAEMRVLGGQHRNTLRQIYPNPFIRLTRNLLVFAGNVLKLVSRIAWRGTKWMIGSVPRQKAEPANTSKQITQQKKTYETKSTGQKQESRAVVDQVKSIVRKLPVKPRVQMPVTQSRGMKR